MPDDRPTSHCLLDLAPPDIAWFQERSDIVLVTVVSSSGSAAAPSWCAGGAMSCHVVLCTARRRLCSRPGSVPYVRRRSLVSVSPTDRGAKLA